MTRASRHIMRRRNNVAFVAPERLEAARASGRGLLTLSNHVCLFDDPWLTACLAEPQWESLRWIGADALNFFGSPLKGAIFNAGKCVPIVRGAGIDQPGMHFLAEQLKAGEWVHMFPEGTRTRRKDGGMQSFKPGFAHLIKAARPLVLPFHHDGMAEILPVGARWPRRGRTVQVRFGEPLDTREGMADAEVAEIVSDMQAIFSTLTGQAVE